MFSEFLWICIPIATLALIGLIAFGRNRVIFTDSGYPLTTENLFVGAFVGTSFALLFAGAITLFQNGDFAPFIAVVVLMVLVVCGAILSVQGKSNQK